MSLADLLSSLLVEFSVALFGLLLVLSGSMLRVLSSGHVLVTTKSTKSIHISAVISATTNPSSQI